ncbi:MAG: peptidoglycan-binding protein [Planctomycetes bacterium]|nr:peptidoglycan-binding protein [Planctomycetota bacterium]
MSLRRVFAAAAPLLLLCAAADAQTDWVAYYHRRVAQFERENRQLAPTKKHVVLVGDSLTEGWARSGRTASYLPRIAERVLNRGIGSDRVGPPRGVLSRMDASIFDTQPSHVVLLVGVNQIGSSGSGIPRAVRDYESIVRQVRARLPDVPLIAVSTPPVRWPHADFKQPVLRYNAELARIAQAHGAQFLDLHALLVDDHGWLRWDASADGLHLTDKGYRIYGQALEALILGSNAPGPATDVWLQRGSRGPAVSALQQRLNLHGARPQLSVDGAFGADTEAALKAFQRRFGLAETGREDPATRAALAAPLPLGFGRRGAEVERLQRELNARGASLVVDGRFGLATEAALQAFQRDAGLEATGRVDPQTRAALSRPLALARGSEGPEVTHLQQRLNANGATLEVDGKFGPLTEAAVRAFQRAKQLPDTGRADPATLAALAPAPPGGLLGGLGQ